MKRCILALALLAGSSSALANEFYVGAAYSQLGYGKVAYSTEVETDNGFAATLGYNFIFGDRFTLGAEIEYKDLGGVVEKESVGTGSYVQMDLSATSVGVNAVPKFYMNDNFYILGKVGMHNVSYTAKFDSNVAMGYQKELSDSSVEFGFGGGVGYHFGQFTAQTTYEVISIDSSEISAINIGAQYNF